MASAIPFQNYDAPAWGAVAITPADGVVITTGKGVPFRSLYVGGAGNISLRLLDGSTQLYMGVPVGTTLDIQFDIINATGTTATHLIGQY